VLQAASAGGHDTVVQKLFEAGAGIDFELDVYVDTFFYSDFDTK
jgi:hypothetical protein